MMCFSTERVARDECKITEKRFSTEYKQMRIGKQMVRYERLLKCKEWELVEEQGRETGLEWALEDFVYAPIADIKNLTGGAYRVMIRNAQNAAHL